LISAAAIRSGKTIRGGTDRKDRKLADPVSNRIVASPAIETAGGKLGDWVTVITVATKAETPMTADDTRRPRMCGKAFTPVSLSAT
jgi:hypothetical protein